MTPAPAAAAPAAPATPRPAPEPFVPKPSTDVSDLVAAMSAGEEAAVAPPPAPTRPGEYAELRTTSVLKPMQPSSAPSVTATGSGSPNFRPLPDPMAARAITFSVLGFLLCVLPLVSLVGVVLGVLTMRRIQSSNGLVGGMRTARSAVIIGAAGIVGGIAIDLVFLLTK